MNAIETENPIQDNDQLERIQLRVDNGLDIRFHGVRLARIGGRVSSEKNEEAHRRYRYGEPISELSLYRTQSGVYVCKRVETRLHEYGIARTFTAVTCETTDAIYEFFGFSRIAKALYHAAQMETFVFIN